MTDLAKLAGLLAALSLTTPVASQNWQHPAVERYGDVVAVPGADFVPDRDRRHRIVFDLAAREDKDAVNVSLWYLARLVNLYALAGVRADSLDVVGVLHGGATTLALSREAATARAPELLDDLGLLEALAAAGVRFVVCGQSAASAGIDLGTELHPNVAVGLSAMTTIAELRARGYVGT